MALENNHNGETREPEMEAFPSCRSVRDATGYQLMGVACKTLLTPHPRLSIFSTGSRPASPPGRPATTEYSHATVELQTDHSGRSSTTSSSSRPTVSVAVASHSAPHSEYTPDDGLVCFLAQWRRPHERHARWRRQPGPCCYPQKADGLRWIRQPAEPGPQEERAEGLPVHRHGRRCVL